MIAKALLFIFSVYFVFCGALAKADTTITVNDSVKTQATNTYYYNFGSWPVNTQAYADFYVLNDGAGDLAINDIFVWGPSYSAVRHCPSQIRSGYRCLVRTYFQPWTYGYVEGRVSISTSRGNIEIMLSGTGY